MRLLADEKYPLQRGEIREDGDEPYGDDGLIEQQQRTQHEVTLHARQEADFGREAHRFGAGFHVGDQHRPCRGGKGDHRRNRIARGGKIIGQRAQDRQLGVTVGDRVHEGAPVAGLAAQARHCPIQRIERGGDEHDQAAERHPSRRDEIGRDEIPCQPHQRHHVGRQADAVEERGRGVEKPLEPDSQSVAERDF